MTIDAISTVSATESLWPAQSSFGALTASSPAGTGAVLSELEAAAHRWVGSSRLNAGTASINPKADSAGPVTVTVAGTSNPSAFTATSRTASTAPPRSRPDELVTGLKKWTGVIQQVEAGLFTAELLPLDHEGPSLLADFDLNLLAPDDTAVGIGDVIYLTTRYVQAYDRRGRGYQTATTQVRLRRLGQWSEKELTEIERQAQRDAAELAEYAE
jgi:hypothetical protein